MTNQECIERIWALAKPKDTKGLWRSNCWPIIKTSRGALENACNKLFAKKTDEEKVEILKKIELSLPEIAKARKNDKHMPQPIVVSRFINEKRWLDCMELEVSRETDSKKCHCGKEWPCEKHFYDNMRDDWRWNLVNQEWRRLNRPKTQAECIEALRREGKLNLLLILKRPPGKRGGDPTKMGDI